jgi:hypothetical protein
MIFLADLQSFDLVNSDVSVWVFKDSNSSHTPKFNGRWIGITADLEAAIKGAVQSCVDGITETIEYGVLAQNNENSALTIMADETYINLIAEEVENETVSRKVKAIKQLSNSKFYVVKCVSEKGTLLAIKKTDASWSTRKSSGMIRMIYADDQLDVDSEPTFAMQSTFDFFVLETQIFVVNKLRFESVLQYKEGHLNAFQALKSEPEFIGLFADVNPIDAFVGSNKIHLRRAIAIQQKGHYKDAAFMDRLRSEYKAMNLLIDFDHDGRIVPTIESCRHIFLALLDHRLDSRLSTHIYDVPNTEPVV